MEWDVEDGWTVRPIHADVELLSDLCVRTNVGENR